MAREYQGSAKSTPFDPLRAVDQTDEMRRQLQERLQWMREDQNLRNQDRASYASRLDQANQFRINSLINQGRGNVKDWESLANMSKTLSDTLLEVKKTKDEMDREEGLALFYQNGVPLKDEQEFALGEAKLRETKGATEAEALVLAKNGAPPEIVERIKGLSGWKKYGYMMGLAQEAGTKYSSWLDDRLANDDQTQIQIGDATITPKQAAESGNQAQLVAVTAVLRQQYFRETGLTGANPALLNKYTFPDMKEGESQVLNRRYAAIVAQKSQDTLDEEMGTMVRRLRGGENAGVVWNDFITSVASLRDPKDVGSVLGLGRAREMAEKFVRQLAVEGKEGVVSTETIQQILNTPVPGGKEGETWGSRFGWLFTGVQDQIQDAIAADVGREENERSTRKRAADRELIKLLSERPLPPSSLELQDLIKNYRTQFGENPPAEIMNFVTAEEKSEQDAEAQIEAIRAAQGGQITMKQLLSGGYPQKVIDKYKPKAIEFEVSVTNNPGYKENLDAVKAALRGMLVTTPGTQPHPSLKLAEAQAIQDYTSRVTQLTIGGMKPSEAAAQAAKDVIKEIEPGKKGIGKYALNVDPASPNVITPNTGFKLAWFNNGKTSEAEAYANRIINAVRNDPRSIGTKQLIPPVDFTFLNTTFRSNPTLPLPASIVLLSQAVQQSPWLVVDAQLRAFGADPIQKPPAVAYVEKFDPRFRQILERYSTPTRTQRAFTSQPWAVEKVPNGWGAWVNEAGQKYGIEPSLLAGLLAWESDGWNPRAVSSRGAKGLAQIMDNTLEAAGVTDPFDPKQAIFGAAKYLSDLRNRFGSMNKAIWAYNAGPNSGIENRNEPFPGENAKHFRKVLEKAAMYGYNPSGANPYRNPAVTNPSLIKPEKPVSVNYENPSNNQGGIDLYFESKRVPAVMSGVVKDIGFEPGYGNYVVVESRDPKTGQPVDVLYGHIGNSQGKGIGVKIGQQLSAGTPIGVQGSTGNVINADSITSIDFFAPAPRGSKSMVKYGRFQQLRKEVVDAIMQGRFLN